MLPTGEVQKYEKLSSEIREAFESVFNDRKEELLHDMRFTVKGIIQETVVWIRHVYISLISVNATSTHVVHAPGAKENP